MSGSPATDGYVIRHAGLHDIPELVRVINAAYRVEDFFINGNRTNEADITARMADPSVRFIVQDGPDAGTIAAAVLVDVHGSRGHLGMLSVEPAFQGQGLGRRLMEAVEEHCRAAGCDTLELEAVNLREELPALYEAMGFSASGTAPFPDPWKLSRDAHLVVMRKALTIP